MTAKKFLENKVMKDFPFKVKSIQVDGGSEFMRHFEEACGDSNIPLYVLPPAEPKYNGRVERSNRIVREEFYARKDIIANNMTEMREELKKFLWHYNNFRPHSKLDYLTPIEYFNSIAKGRINSQML